MKTNKQLLVDETERLVVENARHCTEGVRRYAPASLHRANDYLRQEVSPCGVADVRESVASALV